MRYSENEILEFIKADYKQRQQLDDIVYRDEILDFNTTIDDWRDICDLVDNDKLGDFFNVAFKLDITTSTWLSVFEPSYEKTLKDICLFVSEKATRESVEPIKLFGNECLNAGLFKTLMKNLQRHGVDTKNIRPSTRIEPLFRELGVLLIQEVNLLNPHALPPIDFKSNWIYKWGRRVFISCFGLIIILGLITNRFHWWVLILGIIAYLMMHLGVKINPSRARFENIDTFGDLIRKINTPPNK